MDVTEIRERIKNGTRLEDIKLRVTYYARVSTGKDEQINSFEGQAITYEQMIKNNPNWIFVEGYKDKGKSGKSIKGRMQFQKMIEDARAKKFDLIITKEVSRFSRNALDSLTFAKELMESGVGVLFETENLFSLDPDKDSFFGLISIFGQEEVKRTSNRVKRGFEMAIKNNHSVLGNDNIWGYNKKKIVSADGRSRSVLEINEEQAEIVRTIFDLYALQGLGIRGVCRALDEQGCKNSNDNPFSFSTVKGILTNPKYKGTYCAGRTQKIDVMSSKIQRRDKDKWTMFKDETGEIVPAIVSEELWDIANNILQERSEKMSAEDKTSYQNKYPFSGKIICMQHKTRYHRSLYRYKSGNKEVWQCKEYSNKGKSGCDNPKLYTKEIEEIMQDAIQSVIKSKDKIIRDMIAIYEQVSDAETQRTKVDDLISKRKDAEKELNKARELLIKGVFIEDDFVAIRNKLDNINKQLEECDEENRKTTDIKKELGKLEHYISNELNFDEGIDKSVIDKLLDRIEVYKSDEPNTVKIKVFFKVIGENGVEYKIPKSRGRVTSVCSKSYT